MKKPYEEPVLEIMLFSVSMAGSSDGVTTDIGGGSIAESGWFD